MDNVKIDYCYFVATGGGLTFGGGEPLLQSEQIKELKEIIPKDVKLNVETSLNVPTKNLEDVLHIIDEFILDIKSMMHNVYMEYTGKSNSQTMKNLNLICNKGLQHKCTIRVPNIPNFTTKSDIVQTINIIGNLGFRNIDTLEYLIK
jgi:pyruvate formate lyase activating enzyme